MRDFCFQFGLEKGQGLGNRVKDWREWREEWPSYRQRNSRFSIRSATTRVPELIMKEMGHFFPPLLNRIMRVINGEEAFFLYNVMYRGSLY